MKKEKEEGTHGKWKPAAKRTARTDRKKEPDRKRKADKTEAAKATGRLKPLLDSFGDEPVMVTVTFGEGKDAGR